MEIIKVAIKIAKQEGLSVSLDLASFEVVFQGIYYSIMLFEKYSLISNLF